MSHKKATSPPVLEAMLPVPDWEGAEMQAVWGELVPLLAAPSL